jgi:glycosyltransferase involved in cell wall biosynthesis
LNIGYVGSPKDGSWSGSGGDAYSRLLVDVLSPRYEVEKMGAILGQGNKIINGIKLAFRLLLLKGTKNIWIRDFSSTVSLPVDRTKGKNLLLLYHIDSAYLSYPKLSLMLEKVFYHNLGKIDIIVVISKYWKEHFEARGYNNVRIIYNSFNPADFTFATGEIEEFIKKHGLGGKPVVYIGNCQKNKGAVEAYEELKDLDVHLVTSGQQKVLIPATNLNLNHRDYIRLLKASSLVVTMSKFREGWNRTVHEAMLCMTPVIGSGSGGMKELLDGGQQIICGEFGDLRQSVLYALDHPEMGDNGYAYAKNFTQERFESEWLNLIDEIGESL